MSLASGVAAAALLLGAPAAMLAVGAPAAAVEPDEFGVFASYEMSAATAPNTFAGTATFATTADASPIEITTDSTTVKVPTGESAFLGASTGFGQYFGSTRSQPYLYLSPSAGNAPSTTTLRFTGAVPPLGWGFAVGDIDADYVTIEPLDAGGAVLPLSTLNAQDTGGTPLLNYCANAVPKPSSCVGPGPFTDHPWWLTTAGPSPTLPGPFPAGSVVGNGIDTYGSYDWFLPSAEVHGLRLTFTVQSGIPIYQLWLAAVATKATITGTVVLPEAPPGTPVPDGTKAELHNGDGTPVLDIEDQVVTTPVAPDGSFAFETEQRPADDPYQVVLVPPARYEPPAPTTVVADAAEVEVQIELVASPTTPAPTPTATPAPALAESGFVGGPWFIVGGVVLLAGLATVVLVALRRQRAARSGGGASEASETGPSTSSDDGPTAS
ncbi:hypothetical protein ASE14_14145 [Agromyces sp. Root81]|nr:hypothetical protein ASE14_14145 [Agromyces sp. Root81]